MGENRPMLVLGIETSCDETAAAVLEDGRRIRSNVVASQVELHAPYGGIVPELASRRHLEHATLAGDLVLPGLERSVNAVSEVDLRRDRHGEAIGRPGILGTWDSGLPECHAILVSLTHQWRRRWCRRFMFFPRRGWDGASPRHRDLLR